VPSQGQYADSAWIKDDKDYAALITLLDDYVGLLLNLLEDLELDQNTLILFTSDNGWRFSDLNHNGHLRGIKRDLHERGIRVPFIVRLPGTIQPGSVTGHISAFWDFLPTACEVAGVDIPDGIDGISYLPVLTGKKQPEHDYLYWEFYGGQGKKQAVRMGNWKAVRLNVFEDPDGPIELYDLERWHRS